MQVAMAILFLVIGGAMAGDVPDSSIRHGSYIVHYYTHDRVRYEHFDRGGRGYCFTPTGEQVRSFTVRQVCDTTWVDTLMYRRRCRPDTVWANAISMEASLSHKIEVDTVVLPARIADSSWSLDTLPRSPYRQTVDPDSVYENVRWTRAEIRILREMIRTMPTREDFSALRRWSLDQDYKTCIDTMDGGAIVRSRRILTGYITGSEMRRAAADSCCCLVYGRTRAR